ncbi:MAG: hypothetical protein OHK0039_29540 [Bacteroidia bacterium]
MLRIFGIRHHGPGSARRLCRALEAFAPDCLLIEGPPEGDAHVALVADAAMVPPVALLVYPQGEMQQASFFLLRIFRPNGRHCAMLRPGRCRRTS